MKDPRKFDASKIIQNAESIVNQAKYEILATMDLAEEIRNPLPRGYFFLLQKKMKEGVRVKRLAFGNAEDFRIFQRRNRIRNRNYLCRLTSDQDYRRMLLVDRRELMFAVEQRKIRHFFRTTRPKEVRRYLKYFSRKFKTRSSNKIRYYFHYRQKPSGGQGFCKNY